MENKQELIERYKEKQESKFYRFSELSEKANKESKASYERSNSIVSGIPMGQPILVGHHSEKRHRNDLKRSWNAMNKSVELQKKSEYYADKANATQNNNTISSDNPEAVDLLKEKLSKLESQREKIKELNKQARKEKREGCASWVLSNLGQNIRTVKQRIEYLNRQEKVQEEEIVINGVKLKTDKEDNRVRLFFDGKPSEEIRSKLKSNGFRWSPYNGC